MNISPLLWGIGIRKGSAGRVQSPALKMIVEREEEIRKFIPIEYWSIQAQLLKDKQGFISSLVNIKNEKLDKFFIKNKEQAEDIKNNIIDLANKELAVSKITKKQKKRQPAKPFTTSTLQQEASRKLRFGPKRTMGIAQELYTVSI